MKLYWTRLFCAAAALVGSAMAGPDAIAEPVRWKVQSTFPKALLVLGESGPRVIENMETISGGDIQMRWYEPGALVPALQAFDAVSAGSLDAAWGSAGYFAGKEPSASFFTAVPFGPDMPEYLAWMYYAGGRELQDEVYKKYNVKPVPCAASVPESAGWFRREIKSVKDFQGLKMRFFGLGSRVLEKVGVSTQLLAGGDIYPALELGTIDATEFANPALDIQVGFHQVAKYYYFPGWHQPYSLIEFQFDLRKWDALSEQQKTTINIACRESIFWASTKGEAIQGPALSQLEEKGVTIGRLPDDVLQTLQEKWEEVVQEQSAEDPVFKRIYEHYSKFRENYASWKKFRS